MEDESGTDTENVRYLVSWQTNRGNAMAILPAFVAPRRLVVGLWICEGGRQAPSRHLG